jgi:hypothetical protein
MIMFKTLTVCRETSSIGFYIYFMLFVKGL